MRLRVSAPPDHARPSLLTGEHARLDDINRVGDGGGHEACDTAPAHVHMQAVLEAAVLDDATLDFIIRRAL